MEIPREFWYSAIIHRDKKKLSDILSSIKNEKTDIEILSPDINISDFSFTFSESSKVISTTLKPNLKA